MEKQYLECPHDFQPVISYEENEAAAIEGQPENLVKLITDAVAQGKQLDEIMDQIPAHKRKEAFHFYWLLMNSGTIAAKQ